VNRAVKTDIEALGDVAPPRCFDLGAAGLERLNVMRQGRELTQVIVAFIPLYHHDQKNVTVDWQG